MSAVAGFGSLVVLTDLFRCIVSFLSQVGAVLLSEHAFCAHLRGSLPALPSSFSFYSKPELNGLRGTIKSLAAGRCEVVVDGPGAQHISVRHANLRVVDTGEFCAGSRVTVVRVKQKGRVGADHRNGQGQEGSLGSTLPNGRVQFVFDNGQELSLKDDNLEAMGGPTEGRLQDCDIGAIGYALQLGAPLQKSSAEERWTVELTSGGRYCSRDHQSPSEKLRPPDVKVPSSNGLQWSFDDLTDSAVMSSCKLSSTRATFGERTLENIRKRFDVRFEEVKDLSNAIATTARLASGDFSHKIALPNVLTWDGMVRAEMPRATTSLAQATKTLHEAEMYLTGLRWEWECYRTFLLQASCQVTRALTLARSLSGFLSRALYKVHTV
jgi:hypothetical protein